MTTQQAAPFNEKAITSLLVPFKKVQFLPAYFYKVFIKKKKQPEAPAKAAGPQKFKIDPKTGKKVPIPAPAAPQKEEAKDTISVKTKKL